MEIEKLAAEIGISPETLRSLYRSFLEATPDHLAALKKGITGRDAEAVKTNAHHIKGAAVNLELTNLAETSKLVENAAKRGSWEDMTRLSGELELQFQRERETLLHLLQ